MGAGVAAPGDAFFFARFSALVAETPLAPDMQKWITLRALVYQCLQLDHHAAFDVTALHFREILVFKLIYYPIYNLVPLFYINFIPGEEIRFSKFFRFLVYNTLLMVTNYYY